MRHSQSRQGFGRKKSTEEQVKKYLKPTWPLVSVINFKNDKKCSVVGKTIVKVELCSEPLQVQDNKGQLRLPAASQDPFTSQEVGKLGFRSLHCGPAMHKAASQAPQLQRPHRGRMSARAGWAKPQAGQHQLPYRG